MLLAVEDDMEKEPEDIEAVLMPLLCANPKDKTGRQIEVGDTLKIFHFTGARRKRYYMYKYVEAEEMRNTWQLPMLRISHLNPNSNTYLMVMDGKQHNNIEIVQGYGQDGVSFEDRPRT
jgi:hypothetical protein